ncbi:MAG: cation:proton antiporter [Sandaracinaceae bacterium]|nr:cation:proton antiporter [Sandaracinaceae bacterium]
MPANIVADLAIVLGVAAATGALSHQLRQPPVLGYLFAGLVVGPYLPVPLFADVDRMEELSELGVILVMFGIGLEFRIAKLVAVLPRAGIAVLVECAALLSAGYGVGQLLGWTAPASLFLGACMAISSTMTVSKILGPENGDPSVRDLVMSMLVLQDVVAIALIAAMTAVAAGGGLSAGDLALTLGQLALVLVVMIGGGLLIVPRVVRYVGRLASPEALVVVGVGLCFVFAELATVLGYSVALGAFVAGMLVSESGDAHRMEPLIKPLRDVFSAVFFVSIGMSVDPLVALDVAPIALLVTVAVISVQLVSVTVGGILSGNGPRRSITAGLALGQVGEFAFIIASIGVEADVVPAALAPVMVTVAVLTTFTTPLGLARADKLVSLADRAVPSRVRDTLSLYAGWVERIRERATPKEHRSARRAMLVVLVDMVCVTAILGASVRSQRYVIDVLASWDIQLTPEAVAALLAGVAVLVSLPFGFFLMRNVAILSRLLTEATPGDGAKEGTRVAGAAARSLVQIGVMVALGLPAVVVLGWLGSPYPGAGLAVALLVSAGLVWRRAGEVQLEVRGGAGRLLELFASQDPETSEPPPALIPGLDDMSNLSLLEQSHAVGKSLAELDLRAQTGATIVAIKRRDEANAVVPSGRERLGAGDTLAIMGTTEAKELALSLLLEGPLGAGSTAAT